MKEILQAIFGPLNALLGAIPLSAARWLTVAFLVAAALLPLTISRDYVFRGVVERRWYLDLRMWALLCMLPYILIYLLV